MQNILSGTGMTVTSTPARPQVENPQLQAIFDDAVSDSVVWTMSTTRPVRVAAEENTCEKDVKLAQNFGQLQPFLAVSPQECMGQLASFGPI